MKEWAECGNSTNRSRVTKMLEADPKDPRVVGLFSNLISSYGIGGKGGGAALTREGKEVNGNITLFSCQGAEDDEPASLQKINFNLKEAQLRQVCAQPLPCPPLRPCHRPWPRHAHSPAGLRALSPACLHGRQVEKDESPWNREYTPNLDLSDEPELQAYMQRPGWGERITCLQIEHLSPAVLRQLRDPAKRMELVDEIVRPTLEPVESHSGCAADGRSLPPPPSRPPPPLTSLPPPPPSACFHRHLPPLPLHLPAPVAPARSRPGRTLLTERGTMRSPRSAPRSTGRATQGRCTSRRPWRCAVTRAPRAPRRRSSTSTSWRRRSAASWPRSLRRQSSHRRRRISRAAAACAAAMMCATPPTSTTSLTSPTTTASRATPCCT